MWALIAGTIMNSIIDNITYKILIFQNLTNLTVTEKIVGWFLIDHVPKTYYYPSVKYFIINEEFRRLITNILIVFRNIFTLSYVITFTEFFNLLFIEIYLSYFLILHFKFLIFFQTKNKNNSKILFFFFLCLIKNHELLTKYSLNFILIPFLFIYEYIIKFLIKHYVFCIIIIYFLRKNKIICYKFYFYCTYFIILVYYNHYLFNFEILNNNNFLNEFCLKFMGIYINIYYSF